MPDFPAAYCQTCREWLTPDGSNQAARDTATRHEPTHVIAVFQRRNQAEQWGPLEAADD